jgi:hypothetical protein
VKCVLIDTVLFPSFPVGELFEIEVYNLQTFGCYSYETAYHPLVYRRHYVKSESSIRPILVLSPEEVYERLHCQRRILLPGIHDT